jgi:hypothetical protein
MPKATPTRMVLDMKKKRLTPEEFGCSISDPDFLNSDGELILTSKPNGKVKKLGGINLCYCSVQDSSAYNIHITFYSQKQPVAMIFLYKYKIDYETKLSNAEKGPSYYISGSDGLSFRDSRYISGPDGLGFIDSRIKVERERFIDFILNNHPDAGEWVLWNV